MTAVILLVSHPRQVLLKRLRGVVTDSQPRLLDTRQRQNGLNALTARLRVIGVEHSALPALPNDHDRVQSELENSSPSEAIATGMWLSHLQGFQQLWALDGD